MRFTSCNPALGVLTIPFISLSKPVDPVGILLTICELQIYGLKFYLCNTINLKKHSKVAYEVCTY